MCEICESMLAAEHKRRPGVKLCPRCKRFPLDADMPFDPSQWDYVAPEAAQLTQFFTTSTPEPPLLPGMRFPQPAMLPQTFEIDSRDLGQAGAGTPEKEEEREPTCYHCYQVESGLAERCPVCGDSYLPPELRKPHFI